MNTLKLGAFTTLLAMALPLAAAAPAQAAPIMHGCEVTPQAPYAAGVYPETNRVKVKYKFLVRCNPGHRVKVQAQTWEEDWDGTFIPDGDDEAYPWPDDVAWVFPPSEGWQASSWHAPLPYLDDDSADEMYLKVRFRVYTNDVPSNWSPWQRSAYTQIFH